MIKAEEAGKEKSGGRVQGTPFCEAYGQKQNGKAQRNGPVVFAEGNSRVEVTDRFINEKAGKWNYKEERPFFPGQTQQCDS